MQWRPDDRQLLIRGIRPNHPIDLYTVNLDGSDLHPLSLPSRELYGPERDLTGIAWLPPCAKPVTVAVSGVFGAVAGKGSRIAYAPPLSAGVRVPQERV